MKRKKVRVGHGSGDAKGLVASKEHYRVFRFRWGAYPTRPEATGALLCARVIITLYPARGTTGRTRSQLHAEEITGRGEPRLPNAGRISLVQVGSPKLEGSWNRCSQGRATLPRM